MIIGACIILGYSGKPVSFANNKIGAGAIINGLMILNSMSPDKRCNPVGLLLNKLLL